MHLIEKTYGRNDTELHRYDMVRSYVQSIPQIYELDLANKMVVKEDLSDKYIAGHHFNEDTKQGLFVRESYHAILRTAAKSRRSGRANSLGRRSALRTISPQSSSTVLPTPFRV